MHDIIPLGLEQQSARQTCLPLVTVEGLTREGPQDHREDSTVELLWRYSDPSVPFCVPGGMYQPLADCTGCTLY